MLRSDDRQYENRPENLRPHGASSSEAANRLQSPGYGLGWFLVLWRVESWFEVASRLFSGAIEVSISVQMKHLYEFGPFRLEPGERRLLRDGEEVPLPQRAFDVLVVLVSRADHLVSKEDLLNQVWSGTFVED